MTLALCFHHVSPAGGSHANTPERFHDHLSALRRKGFSFLDFDTFARECAAGRSAARRTALVTTDDGYVDNWHWAYPVLRDLGIPAVFFVITGFVGDGPVREAPVDEAAIRALADENDDARFMRWSELSALEDGGLVSIQSHTHRHARREGPEDLATLTALREDLATSREAIARRLGRPPRALAWPWGRSTSATRAIADSIGLRLQFSVTPGRIGAWSSRRCLSRVCVDERSPEWLVYQATRMAAPLLGDAYSIARIGWNVTKQAARLGRGRIAGGA